MTNAAKTPPNSWSQWPDADGRFGEFGGRYVAETLMPLVLDLEVTDGLGGAAVADVAQGEAGIRVERVWIGGDIGSTIINPLNAEQQIRGSVIEGMGHVLSGLKVPIDGGAVGVANFDTYPLPRIDVVPPIEIGMVRSDNPPTGLGEPAMPPAIAAIANAISSLTGQRVRSLPYTEA